MNSQLIYLTKDGKQFLEMYLKFMNASNNIFFFHFFLLAFRCLFLHF